MPVVFRLDAPGTDLDVTQTYYCQVREDATGMYFDADSDSFEDFSLLVDGEFELTELAGQPGCWEVTVDVGAYTGTLTFLPRDGATQVLLSSKTRTVYLKEGVELIDAVREQTMLSHNYSGVDAFRLLYSNGEPVPGAAIRVYVKGDYDADPNATPVGVSITREDGRWVHPVPVNTGITYTLLYHKPYDVGPVIIEVIVP